MWCFTNSSLHESCRMGRRIVAMKLIYPIGYCECDGHTVHKLSQRRHTVDWLAPRESDCSQMHSKVSSDWLPSYIKATRPVLEIFKMAGYFPDSPRIHYVNDRLIPEQKNFGVCGNVPCALLYKYQWFAGLCYHHDIFALLRSYAA